MRKGNRMASCVDLNNVFAVARAIQELLGNSAKYEVTPLRLLDIAQRAELKLEHLEIPLGERAGAKCAFRPESTWTKTSQVGAPFKPLLIERGKYQWFFDVDELYEGPRCRGEVLLLTTAQHKRVVAELERKFQVIEKKTPPHRAFTTFKPEVRCD